MNAFFKFEKLTLIRGSAVDGNSVNAAFVGGEFVNLIGHLSRQLASRAEDQDLNGAVSSLAKLNRGNRKSRSFTRSCLGLANDIVPL